MENTKADDILSDRDTHRRTILNTIVVTLTALLCIAIALFVHFYAESTPPAAEYTEIQGTNGTVAAYSIEDLANLRTLTVANYTSGKYLVPREEVSGKITDLGKVSEFEGSGTLQFVFLNLDPNDKDFAEKHEALSPFLRGDGYWHFTLYLPAITGATIVYLNSEFINNSGQLSDYDFSQYSEYVRITDKFISESEPLFIDLSFSADFNTVSEDIFSRSTIVTIHYESMQGKNARLFSIPIAGENSLVRTMINADKMVLTTICVTAALGFTLFICASVLKHTFKFAPKIFIFFGILGYIFCTLLLYSACSFPYNATMIKALFAAIIPFAAIFEMRVRTKNFPIWIPFAALGLLHCILEIISSVLYSIAISITSVVVSYILAVLLVILAVISIKREKRIYSLITVITAASFAVARVSTHRITLFMYSPQLWLCILLLTVTLILGIMFFTILERRNRYLTQNLKNEVARQTSELREMIEDRDNLLRYLSHDMKKPVIRIKQSLDELIRNENDAEKLKLLDDAERKLHTINSGLTDLRHYSKQNFAAEASTSVNVSEILTYIYDSFAPDCEAQGVRLYCKKQDINAFAKKNMLISVLRNLIFNALEHAKCTVIEIAVTSNLKVCRISVTDDGVGLNSVDDAFRAYHTSGGEENMGLGLYLCRELMHSMSGELDYERIGKKTVFTATLQLAP